MNEPQTTDAHNQARFTRRVGAFSVGTLLSRILGLVRESVFAYLFGAGFATDAFNVAFRIPNMLRDLFAESALSAAFVPTFVKSLHGDDRRQSWAFASNMFNTVALATGALSILGIIFAPAVVRVIALGFAHEPAKLHLTMVLTRIMFPFLLFVAIAAWAMDSSTESNRLCERRIVAQCAPAFRNARRTHGRWVHPEFSGTSEPRP